jgi:hypothetical protein
MKHFNKSIHFFPPWDLETGSDLATTDSDQ